MAENQIALYGTAILFAVCGAAVLTSENITGGIGCMMIAAACAFCGKKSNTKEREPTAKQEEKPAIGKRIVYVDRSNKKYTDCKKWCK